jgi:hypothetical protein
MRHIGILKVALGAMALLGYCGLADAAERPSSIRTFAANSAHPKSGYHRKKSPLQVTIYGRRIGGYSYRWRDVINTYGSSPPPYLDVSQSPGGPFDSGFFFDSAIRPRGGNSPYLH